MNDLIYHTSQIQMAWIETKVIGKCKTMNLNSFFVDPYRHVFWKFVLMILINAYVCATHLAS